MDRTLEQRGKDILRTIEEPHGAVLIVLRMLDLLAEVDRLSQNRSSIVCPRCHRAGCEENRVDESITIEEFANADGRLCDAYGGPTSLTEAEWITTVREKSGLDVRAIMTDLPTELGLYDMLIVYKQDKLLKQAVLKVWVVPAS